MQLYRRKLSQRESESQIYHSTNLSMKTQQQKIIRPIILTGQPILAEEKIKEDRGEE